MGRSKDAPRPSILITGASDGIGAALAESYADGDAALWLGGRNEERLCEVARRCRARGAEAAYRAVDVRDAAAMERWINDCDGARPLTLVIANAGIGGGTAPDRPVERAGAVRAILGTNLDGVVNTVLPAMAAMRRRGSGHIVLMSSLAAYRGLPHSPSYSAAKAAVKAIGEGIRPALRREGIAVSVVTPGFVDTALNQGLASWRPFLVSVSRAADLIRRGVAKKRPTIAFPWPLVLAVRLSILIPDRLLDWALARVEVTVPEPDPVGTTGSAGAGVVKPEKEKESTAVRR